jgi:membrane protease YdiL (CAAX protease family)
MERERRGRRDPYCPWIPDSGIRLAEAWGGIDDEKFLLPFFMCCLDGAILLTPLLWNRMRYRAAGAAALGLRRGAWSRTRQVGTGMGAGFACLLATTLIQGTASGIGYGFLRHALLGLLWILSFRGFVDLVLSPFGEEICFRGFIYGYVRSILPLSFMRSSTI